MNYFEFFDLPVSFVLNESLLKKRFYANSKKFHPDFYTLATEEEQTEILEKSTLNNEAYITLSDFDKRMKYVLTLKKILGEEGSNQIPQDFLMDMMDINEALMELEFDYDPTVHEQLKLQLQNMEVAQYKSVQTIIENYDDASAKSSDLEAIKNYFLKKRYLLRIQENLDKFAAR